MFRLLRARRAAVVGVLGMALLGAACSGNDAGSLEALAQDPVATAASNTPQLSTLVTAVKKAAPVRSSDKRVDLHTRSQPSNGSSLGLSMQASEGWANLPATTRPPQRGAARGCRRPGSHRG
jgi:hypothetical protein